MFTAIAPRYDFLNHVLSLNIDRRWRRRAVAALGWWENPGGVYVDLCAGTLDLAAELGNQSRFAGRVIGADFVVPMLERGVHKSPRVRPVGADALQLPFRDDRFDGCTVGFGVRNLTDLGAGLREMARILRSGGRLVILEFTDQSRWPLRGLFRFYFHQVLPRIGRLVSRHHTAYRYLPASVEGFPSPARFVSMMQEAGFGDVNARPLTLGVATLFSGTRT
jgi:demethylmenaquinone methyltransferase/2-methoxy-6-polyprenyl-1,4-benzoquinol methylase